MLRRLAREAPDVLSRVVVLTGVASVKLEPLLQHQRVWRVMRKPFDIHDFMVTVEACAQSAAESRA